MVLGKPVPQFPNYKMRLIALPYLLEVCEDKYIDDWEVLRYYSPGGDIKA